MGVLKGLQRVEYLAHVRVVQKKTEKLDTMMVMHLVMLMGRWKVAKSVKLKVW